MLPSFMVGQKVIKSPDVLKEMVAQGCEVANHTFDHTLMTKVSPTDLANQLVATNQAVSDACGISPVLMRPLWRRKDGCGHEHSRRDFHAGYSLER